jgi:hypothetical protein
MMFTGLAFPNFQPIAVIVIVAFIGTINPSIGDLGILVPLEHAMLARGVADQERIHAFSRYSLIGALSMAVGTLAAVFPDVLTHQGIGRIDAFRLFYAYAALGLASAVLYRRLPHARMAEPSHQAPLGPSGQIVYRLAALFSLDAFAGGFVVQSLLVLWLFERFDLSVAAASVFFFWTRHTERILLPHRGATGSPFWSRQHHGVHSYPVQPISYPGGILIQPVRDARPAALAIGVIANGCANADVLRHGCGDAAGAGNCRQRHGSPAQPRVGD